MNDIPLYFQNLNQSGGTSESQSFPQDPLIPIKQELPQKANVEQTEILHNCAPFISKLYTLVNAPEYSELIGWSQEHKEKAFVIKDSVRFSSEVLPYHFKHSNIASFVRQLNIYGFHKLECRNGLCFSHDFFVKSQPLLLERIKRKKNKKNPPVETQPFQSENEVCKVFALRMDLNKVEKDLLEVRHEIQNDLMRWEDLKNRLQQIEMFAPMLYQMSQNFLNASQQNQNRRTQDQQERRRDEGPTH
ncbi:heat stress transcription factor C-1, putative [Entamoeba invadens IP1]|uniref:Heat stress transcription factor C-1, putative n=1 Tax=Entamoeba invadens IP1 TaxID=370355 RepID=A0A0A1U2Y6_ENTIV|nr:heat stress transcription factor C-1, putative [Entamoeba invadens IP1]ELP87033.1 heat stress transcription factor C-1, putative [Entamoeba invadens IP1]|eukprot:XP_004253804.1 heat stress transcription factor C-1, putative [Entamoeba invadens IP1]